MIYHGDCSLQYVCDASDCYVGVSLADVEDHASSSSSSWSSSTLMIVWFHGTPNGNKVVNTVQHGNDMSYKFSTALTQEQTDVLQCRVLHLFLRTNGAKVDKALWQSLFCHLNSYYQTIHHWNENLDLCIIAADLAFRHKLDNNKQVLYLVRYGESLEYVGNFSQAICVYEKTAQFFGGNENGLEGHSKAKVLNFIAIAYKRTLDYEMAEQFLFLLSTGN